MRARPRCQKVGECRRCHRLRPMECKDICENCRNYLARPYQPTGVGRGGPGVLRGAEDIAGRLESYAEIRSRHYTIAEASLRLGVSVRTGSRYEARLRAQRQVA